MTRREFFTLLGGVASAYLRPAACSRGESGFPNLDWSLPAAIGAIGRPQHVESPTILAKGVEKVLRGT
jgi:hypothetical protein